MKRALLLALVTLAACNPHIYSQSIAPPGRTANLTTIDGFWGTRAYRVELSQGVALALTCRQGGPCQDLQVVSSDPAIADVRRASLGNLEPTSPYHGSPHQLNSAGFVLVGRAPGTTRVVVKTNDGGRIIHVTVVPPPPSGSEATRASAALDLHERRRRTMRPRVASL